MAKNLRELLDSIGLLEQAKASLGSIPLDTADISQAFDEVIGVSHLAAGEVFCPAGAEQSTVIFYPDTGTLQRFNQGTGRVEVIAPVDPATLTLAADLPAGEEPSASPGPSEPTGTEGDGGLVPPEAGGTPRPGL